MIKRAPAFGRPPPIADNGTGRLVRRDEERESLDLPGGHFLSRGSLKGAICREVAVLRYRSCFSRFCYFSFR